MKKPTMLVAILSCTLLVTASGLYANPGEGSPLSWPQITQESRPWAYNWWLGSAVDPENLARELARYAGAGMGGIHIIPIYGAKGAESRYVEYLSPKWLRLLESAVSEAGRLGMGVDMTTGTGWCFGGPHVPAKHGGWQVEARMVEVPEGKTLDELFPRERVRAVQWSGDRRKAYVLAAAMGGRAVKRAAPGGAGPMINPFDAKAMESYLERFTKAFESYQGPRPRAMYHDSYEYRSSWTEGLLEAFAKRRGYRLEEELAAFCGDPKTNDRAARVRCDYDETISDLMIEEVFPLWIRWCRQRDILTRNQAHGSPANLLDLYALADIPETEMFGRGERDPLVSRYDDRFSEGDRSPLVSKFASSAAHAVGRRLVAAETGTWLAEHFCETLEELKCLVDLLFASGVNHVVYHGTCYSPDDAAWPGWLFYASTQMNPRNAIWRDAPTLNAYIARCQAVLQAGRPDSDVLLYWPIHDLWHSDPGLAAGCTVHGRAWLEEQPLGATAGALWRHGFGFDYVSDRLLAQSSTISRGDVSLPGGEYRVVLVPPTERVPLGTAEKLLELAENGATVVFQDRFPEDVPGLQRLEARRRALRGLLGRVSLGGGEAVRQAKIGKGRVLVGELTAALKAAGVEPEPVVSHSGVVFIRRRHEHGRHYFIANQGTAPIRGWHALATPARAVVAMDPLSGRTGVRRLRRGAAGRPELLLSLDPGHSVILRTFEDRELTGNEWTPAVADESVGEITGPWKVTFIEGGPQLPKSYTTATLAPWTESGDAEAERFAGTAVYSTRFDAPAGEGPWILDLGRVCHSARLRLNGEELGVLIMKPYGLEIPSLKPRDNLLEVEVTNLSANRIRDLDRRKIPWRVFHDINLVNLRYRQFDASKWPLFDSGLLGPVTLRSVR